MFQSGDLVAYGSTGICRIEKLDRPNKTGPDRNKEYYLLKPLFQDGIIYAPVDNPKVSIRPVISAEQAEELIALIPSIQAKACHAPTLQALTQHYQTVIRSHDCRELIEMMMSIYTKRTQAESQKRRLGMVDERFMKQAEKLVYGEFSVALGIPFDEVQPYIATRMAMEAPAAAAQGE